MSSKPVAVLMLPLKVGDVVALLNGEDAWEMTMDYDADYDSVVIRK